MNKSFYRPEIDGLRALAIIPVVFFHAKVYGFSGGFIGVDIFFVISGFLITSILKREMQHDTFSFSAFWARRIRRIFPALITVTIATTIASYIFLLFQKDLLEFGKSLFALSLFMSNMFFMRKQGYFAGPAEYSPLLHTWTLSVEEQFYIVLPFLLFFGWKFFKKKLFPLFLLIGISSFIYSIYLIHIVPGNNFFIPFMPNIWGGAINQTSGFYILPSRVWEFIVGVLLALSTRTITSKKLSEVTSAIGIILILYSVSTFDARTPFPGIEALLPVIGCALIIAGTTNHITLVSKLLSSPLTVWVGLISYPLYLWHWPVLVFAHIIFGRLTSLQTILLIVVSIVLSWITYRVIEKPFREKSILVDSKTIIFTGLCCLLLTAAIGYGLRYVDSTKRIPDTARVFMSTTNNNGPRYEECHSNRDLSHDGPCMLGDTSTNTESTFLLWGDSHAAAILNTIDTLAKEASVSGALFTSGGCIPITGVTTATPKESCSKTNDLALEYITEHNIKNILLVARWDSYVQPSTGGELITEVNQPISINGAKNTFTKKFSEMVLQLTNEQREVYILKQVPEQPNFDTRLQFYSLVHNAKAPLPVANTRKEYDSYNSFTSTFFIDLAKNKHVHILDPEDILCDDLNNCRLDINGLPIYTDKDHLNFEGSNLLSPLFKRFLDTSKELY